jgi:uncharacterized protein involved in tolerance to divalent cations
LIWSITFFEWYTASNSDDEIERFKKNWREDVFSAIEMLHQQYDTVMNMPVEKLKSLLRWKEKLEQDKEKLIKEMKNG